VKHALLLKRSILVLGVILMLLPVTVRLLNHEPLQPGSASYGHARIADIIARQGIPSTDPAMPERLYVPQAIDLVLAFFMLFLPRTLAALLVPFLLGIATLACLNKAIEQWKLPQNLALGTRLAFVLSPFFVGTFTQAAPAALGVFLLTLLFALLAPPRDQLSPARSVLRLLAITATTAVFATLGVGPAIVAIAVPLLARVFRKQLPAALALSSVAAFIVLIAFTLPSFLQTEQADFAKPMPVVHAISDFSGADSLSLFAWLLGGIGLVMLWRHKRRHYAVMIATVLVLAGALVVPSLLSAAHIVLAVLAGYALAFFAAMHWEFEDIKTLTLLVLVCGLLFSTLAHAMALAHGPPSQEFKSAALAAQKTLPENATALTLPEDGFAFAYWSGRGVYLDGWAAQTPNANERWDVAQAVWHAQDIERARPLLLKNGIGALVITQDMRDGKVWDLPGQDLLFLLRNNETFKNAHRSSSVDIWAVNPAPNGQ